MSVNSVINQQNPININLDSANNSFVNSSYINSDLSTTNSGLTAEGGKAFFHYLRSFNLLKEPDILVIPPNKHYYYNENDLINVRTLVFLMKLNHIKDRDAFLQTLYRILPPNVNIIGCFYNSRIINDKNLLSRLSGRFNNLLNSMAGQEIDKRYVSVLFEKYGFNVIDMTDINGLTFFYSQIRHNNIERVA